jgi:hypothetical protein
VSINLLELVWYPGIYPGIMEFIWQFQEHPVWLSRNHSVISFVNSTEITPRLRVIPVQNLNGGGERRSRPLLAIYLATLGREDLRSAAQRCGSWAEKHSTSTATSGTRQRVMRDHVRKGETEREGAEIVPVCTRF